MQDTEEMEELLPAGDKHLEHVDGEKQRKCNDSHVFIVCGHVIPRVTPDLIIHACGFPLGLSK